MLSLQVHTPAYGVLKLHIGLLQPLDGLGIGADGKVAVYHMV